ncbi:MAG: hypothetical protein QOE70_5181 [Chthoniobacter sp.]|jgi:chromosome segregation ATPase|nr:hypothetical protein [Chthoniobacter sp.]
MKRTPSLAGAVLLLSLFTWLSASAAPGEEATPGKSQALLEKVKQQELDRQINARKTESDRLNEDLTKIKTEADSLQQTIDSTASLMTESGQNLEQLLAQRKRLQHTLNVVTQNIDAERRRAEGLQALSEAQNKSLVALTKRIEEIKVASSVQEEESKLLSEGKSLPDADSPGQSRSELMQLRKSLAAAASSTAAQEKAARTAMKAADAKLQLADEAAAKGQRMASEPDAVTEKAAVAEKKSSSSPTASTPPKPIAQGPSAPKASAGAPKKPGLLRIFKGR